MTATAEEEEEGGTSRESSAGGSESCVESGGDSCESEGEDMDSGIDLMRRLISARDNGASAVAGHSRCRESTLPKLTHKL